MLEAAHLTEEQVERFQHRTLEPAELLDVDRHLAGCADCRNLLARESGTQSYLAELRTQLSEHLEYDEIVAGAEGTADAAVLRHLAECAMCPSAVEDLREFRGQLNAT